MLQRHRDACDVCSRRLVNKPTGGPHRAAIAGLVAAGFRNLGFADAVRQLVAKHELDTDIESWLGAGSIVVPDAWQLFHDRRIFQVIEVEHSSRMTRRKRVIYGALQDLFDGEGWDFVVTVLFVNVQTYVDVDCRLTWAIGGATGLIDGSSRRTPETKPEEWVTVQ